MKRFYSLLAVALFSFSAFAENLHFNFWGLQLGGQTSKEYFDEALKTRGFVEDASACEDSTLSYLGNYCGLQACLDAEVLDVDKTKKSVSIPRLTLTIKSSSYDKLKAVMSQNFGQLLKDNPGVKITKSVEGWQFKKGKDVLLYCTLSSYNGEHYFMVFYD